MEKYFAVSYLEIGLGVKTFEPRRVLRAFAGDNANHVDVYLMRETLSVNPLAINAGEIYLRKALAKKLSEDHLIRGKVQITEVPEETALRELNKLKWKRINVSPGLDEFLDPNLMT